MYILIRDDDFMLITESELSEVLPKAISGWYHEAKLYKLQLAATFENGAAKVSEPVLPNFGGAA